MNKPKWVVFALVSLVAGPSSRAAMPAKEIMTRNEDARKLSNTTSDAALTTGGGGSPERVKQFTWWRKLTADNVHYDTLTRFHLPAEIRGEGILFLERSDDQNDVLMYLPSFKKIRRVESQQQSSSFMGSEFSYADIATPHVEDYRYKLAREEPCPGKSASIAKCFVIEAEPASEHVRERTGYSKLVSWVRDDNFMGVRGEYYDLDGVLWKKMESDEITEVDPARHKWMAHWIRLENAKSGRFTTLRFSNVKVNTGIPDSAFTQQNLSREK